MKLLGALPALAFASLMTFWLFLSGGIASELNEDVATERVLASSRLVEVGTWLEISPDSAARAVLADGFNGADAGGAWMLEERGSLRFSVHANGLPKFLSLRVSPIDNRSDLGLVVRVGSSRGEVSTRLASGENRIVIPVGVGPDYEISLGCNKLFSPAELGSSEDTRQMCMRVAAIRLDDGTP